MIEASDTENGAGARWIANSSESTRNNSRYGYKSYRLGMFPSGPSGCPALDIQRCDTEDIPDSGSLWALLGPDISVRWYYSQITYM